MKYTKSTKSIEVTIHGGSTVSADDAYAPLAEFNAGKAMHIPTDEGTTIVPYHAVMAVEVTTKTASETRPDPYYCEGGDDKYAIIDESKTCESCVSE